MVFLLLYLLSALFLLVLQDAERPIFLPDDLLPFCSFALRSFPCWMRRSRQPQRGHQPVVLHWRCCFAVLITYVGGIRRRQMPAGDEQLRPGALALFTALQLTLSEGNRLSACSSATADGCCCR